MVSIVVELVLMLTQRDAKAVEDSTSSILAVWHFQNHAKVVCSGSLCSLRRLTLRATASTHSSVNGSLLDICNSRFVFSFPQLRCCISGVPASPQGSIPGTFFQIPLSSIFL